MIRLSAMFIARIKNNSKEKVGLHGEGRTWLSYLEWEMIVVRIKILASNRTLSTVSTSMNLTFAITITKITCISYLIVHI